MNVIIRCVCMAAILSAPAQLLAETQLFQGDLNIVTSSGKLCEQLPERHAVSLVIETDGAKPEVSGFFDGKDISVGRFSGATLDRLTVLYPYHDEATATGHLMALSRSGHQLVGELREKHANAADDMCNFDLAQVNLKLAAKGKPAADQLQRMVKLFNAKLADSKAHAIFSKGDYGKALPLFQQALDLTETAVARDGFPLDSAILGLGSSYFMLGRFDDFNRLYDERIGTVTNETVTSVLNGQRVVVQLHRGRAAVTRGEYDEALGILLPAYRLDVHRRETIGAIMTAYIRSNRFAEAVSFLEQAGSRLESEEDRKEINEALAMVNFLKAKKDENDGRDSEAEAGLRKAIRLNPAIASFWVALARHQHKAGSYGEASKLLNEGLDHIKDEPSRAEILAALEKMQQIEAIMKSVR